MLYQLSWLTFALITGILISLGLLGLCFSPSVPVKPARVAAIVISILILLTGGFFFYEWKSQETAIRALTGQMEQAFQTYLEKNQKK